MIVFFEHQESGLVAICHTNDLYGKQQALEKECEGACEIVRVLIAGAELRRYLHIRFKHLHVMGKLPGEDWFEGDTALMDYIYALPEGLPDGAVVTPNKRELGAG